MNTKIVTKERPIIFSTEMVKAILAGRKTQTRRVVKPQPADVENDAWRAEFFNDLITKGHDIGCPYGQVGDRLWVREAFWIEHDADSDDTKCWDCGINIAEDNWAEVWYCATDREPDEMTCRFYSKHPSIHMPRWASRITLEITEVRVERLQEISEEDAKTEGITISERTGLYQPRNCAYAVWSFRELWDSINVKRGYGWDTNPWVWVISFQVI
jgi:hypothetical protein